MSKASTFSRSFLKVCSKGGSVVLARTTPLTRARKTLPPFEQTFKKLRENVEAFDIAKVRYDDIQRSSIMGAPAAE